VAAANLAFKGLGGACAERPPREAALVFDQPVAGHEWYATEHDPQGRPFRWSGPLTHSTVDLRIDTRADLEVDLRVLGAIAPDVLDGLRLEVHGEAVPLRLSVPAEGGRRLMGFIPQRIAAAGERGRVRLERRVPRTVSPCDLDPGSADARPVGLALSWLGLRRARSARGTG
jgi:hypothetical protein